MSTSDLEKIFRAAMRVYNEKDIWVTSAASTTIMGSPTPSTVPVAETGGTWINWRPTPTDVEPLPGDTLVLVVLRDNQREEGEVCEWNWDDVGDGSIDRYRVVRESEEDPGWVPWDCTAGAVPPSGRCRIKLRNGSMSGFTPAGDWFWGDLKGQLGEIISYQMEVTEAPPQVAATPERNVIPWYSTRKSQPPLPRKTQMRVQTRSGGWTLPGDMWGIRWYRNGDKGGGDIIAYEICGEIPNGWKPHSPSRDSKRPCGIGEMVEIRVRDGTVGRGHAHKFSWTHNIAKRDAEIVAWRKVSSSES